MKSSLSSQKQKAVFFFQLPSQNGFPVVATGTQLSVRTKKGVKKLKLPQQADLSTAFEGKRIAVYEGLKRLASLEPYDSLIADSGVPGTTPQVYMCGACGFYPLAVTEAANMILRSLSPDTDPKPFKQGSFDAAFDEECLRDCCYLGKDSNHSIDLSISDCWQSDPVSSFQVNIGKSAARTFIENVWGQWFHMMHGLATNKGLDPQRRSTMLALLKLIPSGVQSPYFNYPQPIEGSKDGLLLFLSDKPTELTSSSCFEAIEMITRQIGKEMTGDRGYLLTKGMLKMFFSFLHESAKVLFWMATMREQMRLERKAG